MDTKKWGPHGWVFLHSIAFNYPENPSSEQKSFYSMFFRSIGHVLPCVYCRNSFQNFMETHPIEPYLGSRYQVSYWLYMIHNLVNKKLRNQGNNIPSDPSFEEVCEKYNRLRATCDDSKMTCTRQPKSAVPQSGNLKRRAPLPWINRSNENQWNGWSDY